MSGANCLWAGGWIGAILSVLAAPALATHENNHRFTVFGTVRDARGKALADARVIVVDPKLDEGTTAFTDATGHYEALLHLHDDDLGDEVIVTALEQRQTIRATFNPSDHATERRAQLDFGVPMGSAPALPSWLYAAGVAAVTIGAALSALVLRRRRTERLKGHKKRKG